MMRPDFYSPECAVERQLPQRITRHTCKMMIMVFGLALLAGCQPEKAAEQKPPAPVNAAKVEFTDYSQSVSVSGEIRAKIDSNLSFRVSGKVTQRLVDVGDHVAAGDVLARIDPTQQQADVAASEAAVRSAEAQVRQATSAFDRQKTLLAQGFTTRSAYDGAEEAQRTAQGSLDAAKAQLDTSRETLSYTELKADASGVVTARNIEVGQVTQIASTAFTVAVDGPRDAIFNVYEGLVTRNIGNHQIQIVLLDDPSITAVGTIREVSPTVDDASGTVRVKVAVQNPPPEMTLGSVVIGTVKLAAVKAAVLPSSVLTSDNGKPAVWVVDPQTKAVSLRDVTVTAYESLNVAIGGGLQAGEQVVTSGGTRLRSTEIVAVKDGDPS
ncbi:efflux RND transporter periplasmic adaptor subunit [Phyllobacterium myrsinacearum]|uniref:RND family efflux transporter MFP subunit n=1 Tax=Phyllobacterium myrsinacearum TaxID=28101 RepID=A0A839EJG7_9HYPH|nr:efflux RND transporter periplasmic adaptor subunit [Phyllobacterium myrsinacearum]MBA8880141.1 RND family efflux transporter MFP subunit [Phyllobacterium myrsinacearum]